MEATQLRIMNLAGINLKDFPDNYFRMVEIAEHACVATGGTDWHPLRDREYFECSDFEGIPLTPEWLERAGFENRPFKWSDGTVSNDLFISKDDLWSVHNYDGTFNFFKMEKHDTSVWLIGDIKHVHRLQNIFHALTGTELEIK